MEHYPGFTVEHNEHGIYVMRVQAITRAGVDAYIVADIVQSKAAAAATNHCMRMYVLEGMVFPTPYLLGRLNDAVSETPDALYESSAIVVSNRIGYSSISTLINRRIDIRDKSAFRAFRDIESGTAWLLLRADKVREMQSVASVTQEPQP